MVVENPVFLDLSNRAYQRREHVMATYRTRQITEASGNVRAAIGNCVDSTALLGMLARPQFSRAPLGLAAKSLSMHLLHRTKRGMALVAGILEPAGSRCVGPRGCWQPSVVA